MSDIVYVTSDALFVDMLNNACANPVYAKFGARVFGKRYLTYRVETGCTAITYTARPVERDGNGMPTRYVVIDVAYAPC